MALFPHVRMLLPLAAANDAFGGFRRSSREAGKTHISAPVSARYPRPVLASQIVKVFLLSLPFTEAIESGRHERTVGAGVGGVGEDGDGTFVGEPA